MKTIGTILIIIFFGITGKTDAQSKSDKIYNFFNTVEGCSQFSFSKSMLDVVNIDLDEEGKTITGDLHQVRLLSYNPQKGEIDGRQFIKKAKTMLPPSYDRFDLDDDSDSIEALVLGNKKKATEFHLFIKSDDPESMHFLVSFYGNFNINDIDKLSHIGVDLSKNN